VLTADTRGILRNHPLTLPLTRAIGELSRHSRQVALVVARGAAGLACDECGTVLRCPECGVALSLSRAERMPSCRLCARSEPLPELCPGCGGHRLSPLGWGAERVEAAVRRRFPRLSVSRSDPGADVVVGTAALLRRLRSGSLGCVGFVDLDGLLRVPDFRAGERAFEILWTAAERVGGAGRIIVQTRHPEHYAIRAVREQDRTAFYKNEMRFRAELGYPPFRRLCAVSTRDLRPGGGQALIGECAARLRGLPGVTVYGAVRQGPAAATRARWRVVIKGPPDLPRLLDAPLRPFLERRRRGNAVVEVEMDPVSLS
jgi:primosomal protein N' (replication factor Y)